MLFKKTDEEIEQMLGFPTGLNESFAESVKSIIAKLQKASSKEQLVAINKELTNLLK